MTNHFILLNNTAAETRLLESQIRALHQPHTPLHILEAGCGQKWTLSLAGIEYSLTGIDLDEAALSLRMQKYNDLDNAIIGDLTTASFPDNSFDIIYNAFVLEHVRDAQAVLDNFTRWLKPGGLIILKIPDRYSVYGFLARHTPHWCHVGYYRYVKGIRTAGLPGHAPYPVTYDPVLSQTGLKQYCRNNGLLINQGYLKNNYLRKKNLRTWMVRTLARFISLAALGYLHWRHNDLILVIQKPEKRITRQPVGSLQPNLERTGKERHRVHSDADMT
ncbi:class I SAM-dependent methyltransferase [Alteromonas sp. H39]|uniref:class I SAM-dependent methyltransferase n=1 Tax=Alteromonas sp. H39 TaxID=3389876 RepID=UPI0039E14FDB